MRNAWLILAHNEFVVLQQLISELDTPDSDIYVHIDKKVKQIPHFKEPTHGRLFILEKRIDARWGDVSLAESELLLLGTALRNGPYAHYHILSGTHLPLKPREELIQFYDSHDGQEIMRFWETDEGDADFKLRRYHFPIRNYKSSHPGIRSVTQTLWSAVIFFQKKLRIRHLESDRFYKTDQWVSLTEKAASYLVKNKDAILRKYKWSFCCDEYFIASELKASSGDFHFYDCPNLLFVEFVTDNPKSFPLSALPEIRQKDYYWARKFTSH